jgi:hypothetical protein
VIKAAFRSVTVSGVKFMSPYATAVKRTGEGNEWQINVTCPWRAEESA